MKLLVSLDSTLTPKNHVSMDGVLCRAHVVVVWHFGEELTITPYIAQAYKYVLDTSNNHKHMKRLAMMQPRHTRTKKRQGNWTQSGGRNS